jgi:hypothetical protein
MVESLQEVAIHPIAQESLRSMMVQLYQLEAQVNAYVRGLKDSLNLEGDNWDLNLDTMSFVKKSEETNVNGYENTNI